MGAGKARLIISLTMAIAFTLLIVCASPAFALSTADTVGVADASGDPGTYLEVPVTITNVQNGPIISMIFDVIYNNDALSVVDVQKGALTSFWDNPTMNNFAWGTRVSVVYDGLNSHGLEDGATGSVVLLNVSVSGEPGETSRMNLTNIQLSDSAYTLGTAPAKNGTFTNTGETDLVGLWHFDEGSGETVGDSSENDNTGTLFKDPIWVAGKIGKGLEFDGSTNYVEVATSPSLNSITSQITILAWIKTDFAQRGTIVDNWFYDKTVEPTIGERAFICTAKSGVDAGKFNFGLSPQGNGSGSVWLTSNTAVTPNQWVHVAFVSNGATMAIYLNGELDAIISAPAQIHPSHCPIHIGAWNATEVGYPSINTFFKGIIDEVKIYNKALSLEEIQADYEAGNTESDTSTLSDTVEDVEWSEAYWEEDGLWHITERRSNSTSHSWWYGQESTGTYDTGSANSGSLVSKTIDLTDATDATLNFWTYLQTESTSSTTWDTKMVEISTDDGANWELLQQLSGSMQGDMALSLKDYVGNEVMIRFRFDTVDGYYNNYEGWFIDDITVAWIN